MEFKSTQTRERYKIRQDIDCESENITYLVTCKNVGFNHVQNCRKEFQITSQVFKKSPGCKIEKHFLKNVTIQFPIFRYWG